MSWRQSWVFHRIADWQSKPVTSWRAVLVGGVLLVNVLVCIYRSIASPTWGERAAFFAVSILSLGGAMWFLRLGKLRE